ncbi:type II 3-dehydroquinate dehydratase [Helicobacter muridarum]|uniref:3-dehydroquinate dehydratase n=1 Tax=Helicobacter muridarum TaxID=216 RepID=A0A099TXR0_9HELI|nr:type II 3-dehydroquinate dehydratase [Helicobacter muridarum]TLD99995.1 type II 3-dehydroquinate dehydratase [Helicobacter muridarum]STQ87068.1 3-dehydroquinate dehydratase [Helicobacter muridarum]
MKILVIQGPNLNMLGHRDPRLYGTMTLEQIHSNMKSFAQSQKAPNGESIDIEFFQTNFEGEIIDKLQECIGSDFDGIIMNPGGLSHNSISIADAIVASGLPVVEAHLSNIHAREIERRTSVTGAVSVGMIAGFGPLSYHLSLIAIINIAAEIKELKKNNPQQNA